MYGRYTRGWVGGWVDALVASPYAQLRNNPTKRATRFKTKGIRTVLKY